jgi:hypothetical protein
MGAWHQLNQINFNFRHKALPSIGLLGWHLRRRQRTRSGCGIHDGGISWMFISLQITRHALTVCKRNGVWWHFVFRKEIQGVPTKRLQGEVYLAVPGKWMSPIVRPITKSNVNNLVPCLKLSSDYRADATWYRLLQKLTSIRIVDAIHVSVIFSWDLAVRIISR